MSQETWSTVSYSRKLSMPEAGVPVDHTHQFSWGNLHVSKTAREMYGFEPGSGAVITDTAMLHKGGKNQPAIDAWIIGPDESDYTEKVSVAIAHNDLLAKADFATVGCAHLYRQGIGIHFRTDDRYSSFVRTIHEEITKGSGIRPDEGERSVVDIFVETQTNKILADLMSQSIAVVTRQAYIQWLTLNHGKRSLSQQYKLGGLIVAGFTAVNGALELAFNGHLTEVTPLSAVWGLGYTALGSLSTLRHELRTANHRHAANANAADRVAEQIQEDVARGLKKEWM